MTYDLTTIGEGQIRLTARQGERLSTARELRLTAACSEANVAALLAQLGHRTSWASVLPRGDLAERVLQEFQGAGVDLSQIVRTDGGRVALYFLEPGEYPMPGRVTYDREHTPFRSAEPDVYDWDALLDTRLMLVTGITAALTPQTARVVSYAVAEAGRRDVPVALDVNYRSLLWTGDQAAAVLGPIAAQARLLFCSRRDAETVFGIGGAGPDVCSELRRRFGAETVVATDQIKGVYMSSASHGECAFDVIQVPVIDRPGAGDAFVAGTLHGFLAGDIADGVRIGQRAAAFALTHHGDLTHLSLRELDLPETSDIVR